METELGLGKEKIYMQTTPTSLWLFHLLNPSFSKSHLYSLLSYVTWNVTAYETWLIFDHAKGSVALLGPVCV